jgi:hypothetical protein
MLVHGWFKGSYGVHVQFIGVENYACSSAVQRFIRDSYALQRWFKGNIAHPFALNGYKNPLFYKAWLLMLPCPAWHYDKK